MSPKDAFQVLCLMGGLSGCGGASIAEADAPLDGGIDEVTIYDFALTNDQVRAHFVAQRPFCALTDADR